MTELVDSPWDRLLGHVLPPRCVLCNRRGQPPCFDLCVACEAELPVAPDGGFRTEEPPDAELEIFEEGGRLKGRATGQPTLALLYRGDHTFVPEDHPEIVLVFEVDDAGRAISLTVEQGGMKFVGPRK